VMFSFKQVIVGSRSAVERRHQRSLKSRRLVPNGLLHEASSKIALQSGRLKVSGGLHELYYEVHGHANGVPVVVVHGGPGAGCYLNHTRFFDLSRYKVVLLDQRGCGRSTPRGCLTDNNTDALVSDLDILREHLGIDRWVLFGGSWGVTLSLVYALKYPHRVTALILRGVCTMRQQEIDWMYGGGVGVLKPWAWQRFLNHLDPDERITPLLGYYGRLLSSNAAVRDAAAQHWMEWDMSVGFDARSQLLDWDGSQWRYETFPTPSAARIPPRPIRPLSSMASYQRVHGTGQGQTSRVATELFTKGFSYQGDPRMSNSTAQALLECHYSIHGGFLPGQPSRSGYTDSVQVISVGNERVQQGVAPEDLSMDEALHNRVHGLRHIPAIAVHGQMDFVCPSTTVFELHKTWPELQIRLVPGAGHSMYDPAITHELVEATELIFNAVKRTGVRSVQTN
ncbi:hypothetical protein Vafri_8268, partial [Volvox africanus]